MSCNFIHCNVIIVTMTSWVPELRKSGAPIYVEIADAIARDIDSGRLKPRDKLPPQRNLAFDIKVTIGTVSRGYALARERGLVSGEIGRGTYINDGKAEIGSSVPRQSAPPTPGYAVIPPPDGVHPAPGKLRLDSTSATEIGQSAVIARHMQEIISAYPEKTTDYIRTLKPEWQAAGQEWLTHGNWRPERSGIVPTLGVHAGMMAVIASLTAPGDKVAFEAVTYASLARAVNLIGRRAIAAPMTPDGVDIEALEGICANLHPKILVTIPTLQNPTTVIMPPARRRQLAELARRHNLWLIEDNIYGAKLHDTPAPVASYAPERTFFLSGLSKTVAAGLRAGWVASPPGYAERLPVAHKLLTGGMPFLLAEKGARIVLSGEAEEIAGKVRAVNRRRVDVVREIFAGLDFASHPDCPFIWLKMPESWRTGTYVQVARDIGLLVDGDYEFQFTQAETSLHRVRIAFSTISDGKVAEDALRKLRNLLDAGPSGYDSYA